MLRLHRLPVAASIALAVSFAGLASSDAAQPTASLKLTTVDRTLMIPAAKVQDWHDQRDAAGPAYTGGPAWKKFMALIEAELKTLGAVEIVKHPFRYTRWYTTEFPDKSGWSLTSDGTKIDVASYGTQSGSTGSNGVTAPTILYDLTVPVERRPPLSALAGKIVVVRQQPYSTFATPRRVPLGVPAPAMPSTYCGNPPFCTPPAANEGNPSPQWGTPGPNIGYKDYEYRSDPETFPGKLFEKVPVSFESSYRNRDQFGQIREVITNVLVPSGASAAVTVMDLSPLAAQGTRIHPTPRQFNVPLLMLDRVAGEKVLADAATGKTATLILDAHQEENATAYEIVATLPGRNHGTPSDEAILLATHVDGPSIVEDNGGLGILAVLNYYAKIPQAERPKSIVVYFETRHFIPGTEASYPLNIIEELPDRFKTVVGGLALEHFGGLQFAETDNTYAATGRAATTHIWGWPNPLAIEEATNAIRQQGVPRAINIVPARPGVNGGVQLNWLGGGFSRHLVDLGGWPGWHISGDWPSAGFQAYYPSAKTRISTDVFLKQTAAAVQLVNVLMTKDVIAVAPAWGYLQVGVTTLDAAAFIDANLSDTGRAALANDFEAVFDLVKAGRYEQVPARLESMSADADRLLRPASAAALKASIDLAGKMAERGAARASRAL
jgi:hypothetical protein